MEFPEGLSECQYYAIQRRLKKIKLKELAQNLHCSIPLISMYENNQAFMSFEKQQQYKKLINDHK